MTVPQDPVPFRQHLLPPNATPYMRVMAGSASRVQDIPVPIHLVRRPYEVPAVILPHLAWEVSLDVWFDDWPEWRKRRATAKSIGLHYLKGTVPGVRGWLDLLGAELVHAVVPPEGCYALRARTAEERLAFAARFAQLRIYLFRRPGQGERRAPYAAKHGKGWAATPGRKGARFARPDTSALRYGRRAAVWDKGLEREVRWSTLSPPASPDAPIPAERITVPATARRSSPFAIGAGFHRTGKAFAAPRRAAGAEPSLVRHGYAEPWNTESRIYTLGVSRDITPARPVPLIRSTSSGLDLLDLQPERVHGRARPRFRTVFAGRNAARFVAPNVAAERIYDRFYLFDPDRVTRQRRFAGGSFVGHSRARLGDYRAELRVSCPGFRPEPVAFAGRGFARSRTATAGAQVKLFAGTAVGRIARVAKVIRAAKALRDEVWFTTQCHRTVSLRDRPVLGSTFQLGLQVPILT